MGKTLADVDLQVRQLIGDYQRTQFTEDQVREAINWGQNAVMRLKGFKVASRLYTLDGYPTGDLPTDLLAVKRVQLVQAATGGGGGGGGTVANVTITPLNNSGYNSYGGISSADDASLIYESLSMNGRQSADMRMLWSGATIPPFARLTADAVGVWSLSNETVQLRYAGSDFVANFGAPPGLDAPVNPTQFLTITLDPDGMNATLYPIAFNGSLGFDHAAWTCWGHDAPGGLAAVYVDIPVLFNTSKYWIRAYVASFIV